jgi:hypothetical protein
MVAMTVKTYAQQLEEVQAAIAAIEGGAQQYMIGERQLTRGNLATLYERERWLRGMAAREASSGSGIRVRYVVPQ